MFLYYLARVINSLSKTGEFSRVLINCLLSNSRLMSRDGLGNLCATLDACGVLGSKLPRLLFSRLLGQECLGMPGLTSLALKNLYSFALPYSLVFNSSLLPLVLCFSFENELKISFGPIFVLIFDVGRLLRRVKQFCSCRYGYVNSAAVLRVRAEGEISASSDAASRFSAFL